MSFYDPQGRAQDRYDTALICENGHVLNSFTKLRPFASVKFCADCGAPGIKSCPSCKAQIRGGVISIQSSLRDAPSNCTECGKPFPWTAARLEAARQLALELEGLDDAERAQLASTLDDLITDTPRSELAASRFKRLLKRATGEGVTLLRTAITQIITDAAKSRLGI